MKKLCLVLLVVILALSLCSCKKEAALEEVVYLDPVDQHLYIDSDSESQGVPDELVYMDIAEEFEDLCNHADTASYSIEHDVNTNIHIDTVKIEFIAESEFLKTVSRIVYQYQYDRASDLWSLISDVDHTDWEGELEVKKDAIAGEWTNSEGSMHLVVHDVDENFITTSGNRRFEREEYVDYKTSELYKVCYAPWGWHTWFSSPWGNLTIYWQGLYDDVAEEYCIKVN